MKAGFDFMENKKIAEALKHWKPENFSKNNRVNKDMEKSAEIFSNLFYIGNHNYHPDKAALTHDNRVFLPFKQLLSDMVKNRHYSFFGTILRSLDIIVSPVYDNYISISGLQKRIWFNPMFFELPSDKRNEYLFSTLLHVALMHEIRICSRDIERWNLATDIAMSQTMSDLGFEENPVYREYWEHIWEENAEKSYQELSASDLAVYSKKEKNAYNLIFKLPTKEEHMMGLGGGTWQERVEKDKTNNQDRAIKQLEDTVRLARLNGANTVGNLQNAESCFVANIMKPKINWKHALKSYMNFKTVSDFTDFSKPNKRVHTLNRQSDLPSREIVLPVRKADESIYTATIAMDVSSSIAEKELNFFISEIYHLCREMQLQKIRIITFNSDVVEIFETYDEKKLKLKTFKHGGGTDIKPVFDLIHEKYPSDFLIVISDMYMTIPDKPKFDVVWMAVYEKGYDISEEFIPKYGKVIKTQIEN